MKRILITGAGSYIGMSFERYMNENFPCDYKIDTIDMIDGSWREKSFAGYDSVFHVAGIAHQKETPQNTGLYYKINRDLASEVAKKAKCDGVGHFVFLSSMSVYGMDSGVITRATLPHPKTHYGKSKLEAETSINTLCDKSFRVAILRPPMVYGEHCKGNYQTIVKIVEKFPVFPYVKNRRSMIYIDNLSVFVKNAVDDQRQGLFFPQDKEYVQTSQMAKDIANKFNKKIYLSRLLGLGVCALKIFSTTARKAFGTLIYDIEEENE